MARFRRNLVQEVCIQICLSHMGLERIEIHALLTEVNCMNLLAYRETLLHFVSKERLGKVRVQRHRVHNLPSSSCPRYVPLQMTVPK